MNFLKSLFGSKEAKSKVDLVIEKTKKGFWEKINTIFLNKKTINDETLAALEEALIQADVGFDTTEKIIKELELKLNKSKGLDLDTCLKEIILELVKNPNLDQISSIPKPYIILVVGVNGVGKTTTIAKLANLYKKNNNKVLIGAADTFRAAAIEQLDLWAKKIDVDIVKQKHGSDPSAVAYDTINKAKAKDYDVVIIDTAGRLHNKGNLMKELAKIKNTVSKLVPSAPNETLLILDGSTGQNAINQVQEFKTTTSINGLVVTKLDGTSKGGVILALMDKFSIPVKYIGTGEKLDDLILFDEELFINSLFSKPTK